MRLITFFFIAIVLSGCAGGPIVHPIVLHPVGDAADGLQQYYAARLVPTDDGYRQGSTTYDSASLPLFYDAQGASLNATWARSADHFAWLGTLSGIALFGAGVGISANAPTGDAFKNAWWVSLLPAAALSWTFHWVGTGWFRQPSVALYNRQLAEHLGMRVVPMQDDFQ